MTAKWCHVLCLWSGALTVLHLYLSALYTVGAQWMLTLMICVKTFSLMEDDFILKRAWGIVCGSRADDCMKMAFNTIQILVASFIKGTQRHFLNPFLLRCIPRTDRDLADIV